MLQRFWDKENYWQSAVSRWGALQRSACGSEIESHRYCDIINNRAKEPQIASTLGSSILTQGVSQMFRGGNGSCLPEKTG